MKYFFDLDETLCTCNNKQYELSVPLSDRIAVVNKLFNDGHEIYIYTARGMGRFAGDKTLVYNTYFELTQKQLNSWGIKYTELILGKPSYDYFICDKAHNSELFFNQNSNTGFIAGGFDIIHNGYIKYFKEAKKYCSKLIVALHEDPSLERSEKAKPIHCIEERLEILSSIKYIDDIYIYKTEEQLKQLIQKLKPDIRFLDETYKNKEYTGKNMCNTIYTSRDHEYSLTQIKNKILGVNDAVSHTVSKIILELVDKDVDNIDLPNPIPNDILIDKFLDTAIEKISVSGDILEFGVYQGRTINYIASKVNQIVYGFDSFEGLPEEWNEQNPKGIYSLGGNLPKVANNVKLIKGWFDETLPGFLQNNNNKISLLNIDCDLYSSTKYVLDNLKNRIVDGTIIIFDEIWKYPGYKDHEIKAFAEFLVDTNMKYECLKTLKTRYGKAIFVVKK